MAANDFRYRVILRPLDADEGGGWLAEIPELEGCVTDGETPEEAISNLSEAQAAWFETARKLGWNIPAPAPMQEDFSGKFTLRLPKSLHARLSRLANDEGISLNQYLLYLITANHGLPIPLENKQQSNPNHSDVIELMHQLFESLDRDEKAATLNWGDELIVAPLFREFTSWGSSYPNRIQRYLETTK